MSKPTFRGATGHEVNRHVRYLVEAYTTPEQFATPKDYLEALTEGLDNLTQAVGAVPEEEPEFSRIWSRA